VTHTRPASAVHTLARAVPGTAVRIRAVDPGDAAELAREGLLPGSLVTVATRTPLGGPLVVKLGRARLALALALAARIAVEPADAEPVR
jgi:Fe2+ transport system protein FeoA